MWLIVRACIKIIILLVGFTVWRYLVIAYWEIQKWWLSGEDVLVVSTTRLGEVLFFIMSFLWVMLAYSTIRHLWEKNRPKLESLKRKHLIFQPIFLIVTALSLNSYLVVTHDEIIRSGFFQLGSDHKPFDQVERVTLDFQYNNRGDDLTYYNLHYQDGSTEEIWYHAITDDHELLKVDRLIRQHQIPKKVLNAPANLEENPSVLQEIYSQ
ncbi:hypothetical protein [Melghirimyces thermohalophilus]|uniref:hypothetical protein n=1 Tax=Melghirimyces thermohalophilus TaxID=1236220 RepID=UPI00115F9F1F|nr:hypothetical protein [Melghirimyces thermohalophilus]